MSDERPAVLCVDFDGVLCDGRPEFVASAWRVHTVIWPGTPAEPPPAVAARFAALRPLVESGWEMPLLLHAVLAGVPDRAFWDARAWHDEAERLLAERGITRDDLAAALNEVRDRWFARDAAGWLALHRFYPGAAARLRAALDDGVPVVVVTTKAERFARALLEAADERLAALPIVGREPGRAVPKPATLARLAADRGLPTDGAGIWLVEDMPETLDAVAGAGLTGVGRFLATWGYNTLEARAAAGARAGVRLLSLPRFCAPFALWR